MTTFLSPGCLGLQVLAGGGERPQARAVRRGADLGDDQGGAGEADGESGLPAAEQGDGV